jgi:hypothetical protein
MSPMERRVWPSNTAAQARQRGPRSRSQLSTGTRACPSGPRQDQTCGVGRALIGRRGARGSHPSAHLPSLPRTSCASMLETVYSPRRAISSRLRIFSSSVFAKFAKRFAVKASTHRSQTGSRRGISRRSARIAERAGLRWPQRAQSASAIVSSDIGPSPSDRRTDLAQQGLIDKANVAGLEVEVFKIAQTPAAPRRNGNDGRAN